MKVVIKGVQYKIKLLKKPEYDKKFRGTYAHLNKETREIVFTTEHVKKNIIIHEVTHAFINSLHLGSCDSITIEDFEEIICEMLEDHLMDINKISNQILRFLKEEAK